MYRLSITDKAKSNSAVAELALDRGTILELESKSEAEQLATRLSKSGERVRVQKAAPQETKDIDGYLIRSPIRYISEPKESDIDGLTFDIGSNQYGEIGQALVCGSYGLSRGIKYYFFNQFDHLTEEHHKLRGISEPYLPDEIDGTVSWSPDCLIQVYNRVDWNLKEMYFCEIKSGDASFERNQIADMRTVAKTFKVFKIRVILDNLPNEYTFRVHEVKPE